MSSFIWHYICADIVCLAWQTNPLSIAQVYEAVGAAELFRLPLPGSGTLCQSTSSRQQHSSPSRNTWKRSYCNDRTGPRSDFGHL